MSALAVRAAIAAMRAALDQLAALHGDAIPGDSAAKVAIAETPTEPFEVLSFDA